MESIVAMVSAYARGTHAERVVIRWSASLSSPSYSTLLTVVDEGDLKHAKSDVVYKSSTCDMLRFVDAHC